MASKRITTGILAHVDAGKTTLSESLLFTAGAIRRLGKVDKRDAFLDYDTTEKSRGITIFSKQARLSWKDTDITILDTPGHVDFSAEMERTLPVMDYAILVISGTDGVQSHTRTLWELLGRYDIPVFIFVNKMDLPQTDKEVLMAAIKADLDAACVDFTAVDLPDCQEDIASCDESVMEKYFDTGQVAESDIRQLIWDRKLFPCYFGSALKLIGIEEFLDGFSKHTLSRTYPDGFGARIYKITRDAQGNRLTHMRITGGVLRTKMLLTNLRERPDTAADLHNFKNDDSDHCGDRKDIWEEKVNQIRIYNGEKFETPQEIPAGEVCAVTGLTHTYPGQGLGIEPEDITSCIHPIYLRSIILPEGMDTGEMLIKLRRLEEEMPELNISLDMDMMELRVQIMGQLQMEILSSLIDERYGVKVEFGPIHIYYPEEENIEEEVENEEVFDFETEVERARRRARSVSDKWLGTEEVDAILKQATHANQGTKRSGKNGVIKRIRRKADGEPAQPVKKTFKPKEPLEKYLLVDGYNVIYAWDELAELARENMDSSRGKLLDELCNYQGIKGMNLIAVFDAYRVAGHTTEAFDYHNIHVVFTKEAETADQYIERFAHDHAKKYDVTVATSDGLEQIIIRGEGCRLLSSRDLIHDMIHERIIFNKEHHVS
ncbi:MAG: NYN domain-containing protein [Clostridiales bacterium]|nr:NYN domain-containing protein [Clostridiales bacterium]